MPSFIRILKRLTAVGGGLCFTIGGSFFVYDNVLENKWNQRLLKIAKTESNINVRQNKPLPKRAEILNDLRQNQFDVLVIGGGASGAGCALDAQTRGLSTALVEMDDFSSGTSSKSTKLIHGGVRYLQAAVMKLDFEQYRMVKEALFERANLLETAPHISTAMPIMIPLYKYWQIPYYWFGIKMYDIVAGKRNLKSSFYISKEKALELFPMLKKDALVGALIYYDGKQNDSRMNLSLIITAIRNGARCANHVSVTELIKGKDETGKTVVQGAKVRDELTGDEWTIKAKSVINATGAFTDHIRMMDDPKAEKLVVPSVGVHVVLPGYFSPTRTGLLDPKTSDGRVIFILPWERMTIAGTTDSPSEITQHPAPAEKDVEFILNEIRKYLSKDVSIRRGDVMSTWAGLRPLVRDRKKTSTAALARNHLIIVSDSNLITIAGGKWTTYRHMAEETVDEAVKRCNLNPKNGCVTPGLLLEGAHKFRPLMFVRLVQDYGMEVDVAKHLVHTYGDRAYAIAKLSKPTGKRWPLLGHRLCSHLPYLEAEVLYAIKEYACTAVDVLARRTRLAFLNTSAAEEALPKIVEIMAKSLNWSSSEQKRQTDMAIEFLDVEMGRSAKQGFIPDMPPNLSQEETEKAIARFDSMDADNKGYISVQDVHKDLKAQGEKVNASMLHDLLDEIDLNTNGEIDLMEYIQLYSGLKGGQPFHKRSELDPEMEAAPDTELDRNGGGL